MVLVVGIGMYFFWGAPTFERAKASKSWPTVSGVVTKSEMKTGKKRQGGGRRRGRRRRGKLVTSYTPQVTFAYELKGQKYVSSNIRIGTAWSSSSSSTAQEFMNKYSVGSSVAVFFDPSDHSYGVLEPGENSGSKMPYWMSLGMVVAGILVGGSSVVRHATDSY